MQMQIRLRVIRLVEKKGILIEVVVLAMGDMDILEVVAESTEI